MAMVWKDIDRGWKRMAASLFPAKKKHVLVGITEEKGSQPHDLFAKNLVTILQVAIWNEFGTHTAPERSFLRDWFDTNENTVRRWVKQLMPSVIKGERTIEDVLVIIGMNVVKAVQERIDAHIPPPNAFLTIQRKGSDVPVIDTKTLRNAIQYVLRARP